LAGILEEGPIRRILRKGITKHSPELVDREALKHMSDIFFRELTTAIETSKALQAILLPANSLWMATEITKPLAEIQEKFYLESKKWGL